MGWTSLCIFPLSSQNMYVLEDHNTRCAVNSCGAGEWIHGGMETEIWLTIINIREQLFLHMSQLFITVIKAIQLHQTIV